MTLKSFMSVVHSMVMGSFPHHEIKHYSFNQTPADENDHNKCIIELSKIEQTGEARESLFVLFDVYKQTSDVILVKKYNSSRYQRFVKMHLFETAQKIIVAEMSHKISYIDISGNEVGILTDFAGTGSISGAFMNSYKKLTFRENSWGEIVKSNLPDYIGMLSDDDSFLIINIKTWTIVEMVKDILPMLEVEQFSILQKDSESKRLFALLKVRSEFYDYSRERIGVWEIKLDKKGNYGIPRGTYAIDGYKDLKTSFIDHSLVVDVEAADSTNALLFR